MAVLGWSLSVAALAVVAFTPLGAWSFQRASDAVLLLPAGIRSPAAAALFIVGVTTWCEVALLPALLYQSRRVDPTYGRAVPGSIRGRIVGSLLLLPVVIAAGLLVLAMGRAAGEAWWLATGVLLTAAATLVLGAGPLLLGRLGDVRPLTRPTLSIRLTALAADVGVPVAAIQEWRNADTSTTVAMVTGMGRARRVLVASDVVRHWSDDEVAVVVAHELAHHVYGDLIRSMGLNAAVLSAGLLASHVVLGWLGPRLGTGGAGDPVALPVVAFVTLAVWLAATPIRHAQSRRQERRADRFALTSTGQADAFVAAIRRASARSLVDDRPAALTRWLFHRHPSVSERLALADRFVVERAGATDRPPASVYTSYTR